MKYGLTSDRQNSFSGDKSVRFSESTGSDLAHIPPIVIVKVCIKNPETNWKFHHHMIQAKNICDLSKVTWYYSLHSWHLLPILSFQCKNLVVVYHHYLSFVPIDNHPVKIM